MNPFEFLNTINDTKKDIMVDDIAVFYQGDDTDSSH